MQSFYNKLGLVLVLFGSHHLVDLSGIEKKSQTNPIVTLGPCYGRFGDRLLLLTKALWIAEKYKLPFQLEHSIWFRDLIVSKEMQNRKKSSKIRSIHLRSEADIQAFNQKSSLIQSYYMVPWQFRCDNWTSATRIDTWKDLRKDKKFLRKIRRLIAPISPQKLDIVSPSKEFLSVALHVRCPEGSQRLYTILHKREFASTYRFLKTVATQKLF